MYVDGVGEDRVVFLGDGGSDFRGIVVVLIGGVGVEETDIAGAYDLVLQGAAGRDALDRVQVYACAAVPRVAVPAAAEGSWLEDRGLRVDLDDDGGAEEV